MNVHKVTLSTKKVVLFKEIELRDEELAAKAASKSAGDSPTGMGYGLMNELVKNLIVEIDGKKLTGNERAQIGTLLTYQEFKQCRKYVEKLVGEDQAEPQVEFVSSGE